MSKLPPPGKPGTPPKSTPSPSPKPQPAPAPTAQDTLPWVEEPTGMDDLGFNKIDPGAITSGVSIVLYAVEKWGKTTFGVYAPDTAIVMAPREEGYLTLLKAGLAPSISSIEIAKWDGLISVCQRIQKAERIPYKTLVFDALTGFEKLCHQHVCDRDYRGVWGEKGFNSYQAGYEVSVNDWLLFLNELDRIKARGVNIVLLGHALVKNFKNPSGPDFDRYIVDLHHKTWGVTQKWADAILFGNYLTAVETTRQEAKPTGHGKGIGGTTRIVYTQRRDAWDAGNRFNMPEEIEIPNSPALVWPTITNYFLKGE